MTYVVAAVFGLVGVWFWWANRVHHLNHLLELASRELELPFVAPTVGGHQFGDEEEVFGRVEGRTREGLRVSVTIRNRAHPELWISAGSARLPAAILEPDALRRAALEPAVDDPTVYVAMMTSKARRLVRGLSVEASVALRGRRVQIQAPGLAKDSLAVSEMPREAVALAQALAFGIDEMPQRLAQIATEDFIPEFAVRAAARLLAEFPEHASVDGVVTSGLSHQAPAMRLLCARHLGPDGADVLLHLAGRGEVPSAIRREALAALAPTAQQRVQTVHALFRLFPKAPDAILPELLKALARLGMPLPLVYLARRYEGVQSTSRAAIVSHAGLHGAQGERLAIRALSDGQANVQTAAARVLVDIGTLTALPPLTEVAQRRFASAEAKAAARDAITHIERRFGQAAGRLAVVDEGGAETGQLAMVTAGGLSVGTD